MARYDGIFRNRGNVAPPLDLPLGSHTVTPCSGDPEVGRHPKLAKPGKYGREANAWFLGPVTYHMVEASRCWLSLDVRS